MAEIPGGGRYAQQLAESHGVGRAAYQWGGYFGQQVRGVPLPAGEVSEWPTYLSRPIFAWRIDWAESPNFRLDLRLNEVDPGFGEVTFWRDQDFVVHGWDFFVPAEDEDTIRDIEDFFDDLQGRRLGFWIATPTQAFRIVAADGTASFYAADRDTTLDDLPALHVAFTKAGQTTRFSEVLSVADGGSGREFVRLTTAVGVEVDETWQAWVAAYVRLAKDEEEGEFEGEGSLYRKFKVVELPKEYAAAETGRRPVFLYKFEARDGGSTVVWRQTSFAWEFDDGANTWTPAKITHKGLKRSVDGAKEEATIVAEWDPASPLYQMAPPALAMPLFLTIYEADFSAPTVKTTLFTGQVLGPVTLEGREIKAKVASFAEAMGGSLPGMVLSPSCNYRVYEPSTCRASRATHEKEATISVMNERTVTITGSDLSGSVENLFAMGWIETGTGTGFERRSVLASSAASGTTVVLTLNAPLYFAEVGDSLVALPGCDGTPGTCINRFGNFRNFGGHRFAYKNLAVKAIPTPEVDAAKK